ncbi:hypothetical protein D9Q98_001107 [Chlorella vulgaris]|uniref:Wax synthase domain-containing protein n=1 Tax=Chlorella vulgaris TaxID=3077 RepID=A0A9D4TZK9_CHLVU|nr:hypothetical protein D9Q98_001107 [Chlorella vulgaris]
MDQERFVLRWVMWQISMFAGGLWALNWRQRLTPGVARLLAALPLLALNAAIPAALFPNDLMTNISAFLSCTVTNFKLLSWAMDRGSLVTPPLTALQFLAVYAWPITPAENAEAEQGKHTRGRGRLGEARTVHTYFRHAVKKAAGVAVVAHILARFSLPHVPRVILQGLSQYLALSLSMDLLAACVGAGTGLAVAPHFDNPYLSTSLADFWNCRWNLTVSNVLRSCVYDPVMDGRLVRRPGHAAAFSRKRRVVGLLLVFAVSGLVHEAMFWSFAGRFSPHLKWLTFFVLFGVLLVAEGTLKKAFKRSKLRVPTVVARILTVAIVNAMLATFWWPPVDQLGIPQAATQNFVDAWTSVQSAAAAAMRSWHA